MWKTVLFDLDGTLTDSAEGITKCVQYALEQLGYCVSDVDELNCFVGPPLKEMFQTYAGLSEEEGEKAVTLYRERYVPTGMYENRLYPRVVQMLELFQKEGVTMAVASSKPEVYVKKILKYFEIDDYFKVVVGSELNGGRVQKKDVVEEAIRRLKMERHKDQVVLIGDTKYDVEGAKQAGIACIAVMYGYGKTEELAAAEPVYVAENVSDIAECVLGQHQKNKKETVSVQLWRMVYPVLMHLFFSSVLSYAALVVLLILWKSVLGETDVDYIVELINSHGMILQMVANMLLLPIAWKLIRRDEWKRKDMGIRSRIMVAVPFGVGERLKTTAFFVVLSILLNQLIAWSGLYDLFPAYREIAEKIYYSGSMVFAYLAVALLAPITEELIYRGLVYRRIRDYAGVRWAVFFSALIFGVIHGNAVQFIFAFIMGMALAAVYERYRTIWAPIVAHIAVNLFSCITEFVGIGILPDSLILTVVLFLTEAVIIAVLGVLVFDKWIPDKKTTEMDAKY